MSIPFWVELLATLTGAISGTMHAVKHDYDLFGVRFWSFGALMVGYPNLVAAGFGVVAILTMRLISVFLHIETKPVRDYSDKVNDTTDKLAAQLRERRIMHEQGKQGPGPASLDEA